MEALKSLRPALNSSLQSARAWFHGMTSSKQRCAAEQGGVVARSSGPSC